MILHRNIDQTLVSSLHGLLKFETGGLECRVITKEYIPPLYTYALVHVIFFIVSGQYLYTISRPLESMYMTSDKFRTSFW